jgi:hypothetical protein
VGLCYVLLLVLMIETPHPLHTHIRSSLYIYKVFQHLLQWLVVIRMLPHLRVDLVGVGETLVLRLRLSTHFILISGLLYIYSAIQNLLHATLASCSGSGRWCRVLQ